MADIKTNHQYMEGAWAADRIAPKIESTVYKSLEGAIIAKTALIENFENQFGFSREMDVPDHNYAWNLGMLDKFKELHGISEEGSLEDREESQGQEEE